MLNGLDLFSGIGGLTIALGQWIEPVAYCESDRYCQSVLLSRMQTGELPIAPIWDDVRTLGGKQLPIVDIIYGGFPCQDISVAGARKGLGAERSGLFFEIIRLAKEVKPAFIFLENVPGIRRFLVEVGTALTDIGYDCRWDIVSAKEVGAPFIGKRWFCLAKPNGDKARLQSGRGCRTDRKEKISTGDSLEIGAIAAANESRMEGCGGQVRNESKKPFIEWNLEGNNWDEHAGFLLRMDDGIPLRSHRLRALGNAVVPRQARVAFERLMGLEQ